MRKRGRLLMLLLVMILSTGLLAVPGAGVSKAADSNVLYSAYTEPDSDSGSVSVGMKGSYWAGQQEALDRINAIRKEACKKGYPDPRDPKRKLTAADYVPIKWSAALEEYARVRACEASLYSSHSRPGNNLYPEGSDYITGYAEVLAWPGGTLTGGVNQWYGEKDTWVNQEEGVTGHYTSMIDPDNTHVGLGGFAAEDGFGSFWGSCVCGRFMSENACWDADMEARLNDAAMAPAMNHIVQVISVDESALGKSYLMQTYSSFSYNTAKAYLGETVAYSVVRDASFDTGGGLVLDLDDYAFTSSNTKILKPQTNTGTFVVNNTGKVTVTAVSGAKKLSKKITAQVFMKAPKLAKLTKGKKQIKVRISMSQDIANTSTKYEIQLATDKKFKKNLKKANVKVKYNEWYMPLTAYNKTVKGLKAKKTYYVRVRAVCEYKQDGRTVRTHSKWSKVKKIRTR